MLAEARGSRGWARPLRRRAGTRCLCLHSGIAPVAGISNPAAYMLEAVELQAGILAKHCEAPSTAQEPSQNSRGVGGVAAAHATPVALGTPSGLVDERDGPRGTAAKHVGPSLVGPRIGATPFAKEEQTSPAALPLSI